MRLLRIALFGLAFLAAAATAPATWAAGSPRDVIDSLHAVLLKTLQSGKGPIQARYDLLAPELGRIYDFRRMIEVATGASWATADDTQRDQLTKAFARLSTMIYADRFGGGYSGEKFEITGDRQGPRDTVLVDTLIHRGEATPLQPGETPTVAVTYVLSQRDGEWRIVDVLLDRSISELAVRRSDYASILRDGGVDQLIKVLNEKADKLAHP
ncbi:MAG: ABC transporter substrate-binding protein [Rhodospirillales bacterium]